MISYSLLNAILILKSSNHYTTFVYENFGLFSDIATVEGYFITCMLGTLYYMYARDTSLHVY